MATHDDAFWRTRLTPEQYRVLREKRTEAPFTGAFVYQTDKGRYLCAACGAELFRSDDMFDAHCGWPSFSNVASSEAVRLTEDDSHGMQRIEVTCANCDGHLGHVFHDAPDQPTGLRFCINSVSLDFKPLNDLK
jgi:peptide-methionine (R)-S-oxide reductase